MKPINLMRMSNNLAAAERQLYSAAQKNLKLWEAYQALRRARRCLDTVAEPRQAVVGKSEVSHD